MSARVPSPSGAREDAQPFSSLWWWHDTTPRGGAAQMAVDEILFRARLARPVLRTYRWTGPAVSFGYAESLAQAKIHAPPDCAEWVRRWTGGGIVVHGGDRTYTLVVPAPRETAQGDSPATPAWNSVALYSAVHEVLARLLSARGLSSGKASAGTQHVGVPCFAAPVRHDVLVSGQKVAGAGQRRTRDGILHQGSLTGPAACDGIQRALPGALARHVEDLPRELLPDASAIEELACKKYARAEWTEMR